MSLTTLEPVKKYLKSAKQWVQYSGLPGSVPVNTTRPSGTATCVITPADPGSLGDAAMVRAISDQYAAGGLDVTCWRYPGAPQFADTRAKLDVQLLRGKQAEATLRAYARLGCVGADVMDGLYAYADSCLRLRLLGLAAAMGLESRLFGFSFNASPHPKTALEFKQLHKDVIICVRDPISHQRLGAVAGHALRLVADMAFLVHAKASTANEGDVEWINEHRRQGRQVIGLNLHPLFSFNHGASITGALIASFAALVQSSPGQAFVLIPHDFRPVFGDVPALQAIAAALPEAESSRLRLVTGIRDPAELKGFVGHLDGVLTGRMHLAIAAMGQGVPVAGVTYQGKFEGLLRHFELEEGVTIAPPDAADPTRLARFFANWLTGLDREAAAIRQHLPKVTELSRLNFI